jgi:dolichol-phosphate mannosyltransferase
MKYKDFTSGFRATRRNALLKALPNAFLSNQYAYKLHLLWSLHQTQAIIKEVPIHFIDREKGLSKLPANSIHDSLSVIFKLRYANICTRFKSYLTVFSKQQNQ